MNIVRKGGFLQMDIIRQIEDAQLREDKLDFNTGDTVRVHYRIKEGTRERIQTFEGTVLKKQGTNSRATFTVRRISYCLLYTSRCV